MRFLPKVVTICSIKKAGFHCKNNHGYIKSANFWLYIISQINYNTSHDLYFIRIEVEKDLIGPEKFQVICPIALAKQLIVNSYQPLHFLSYMSPKKHYLI